MLLMQCQMPRYFGLSSKPSLTVRGKKSQEEIHTRASKKNTNKKTHTIQITDPLSVIGQRYLSPNQRVKPDKKNDALVNKPKKLQVPSVLAVKGK